MGIQLHYVQRELLVAAEKNGEYFRGLSWLLFADPMEKSIFNLLAHRFWLNWAKCRVFDLVIADVIVLFQDFKGWILGKIVRN